MRTYALSMAAILLASTVLSTTVIAAGKPTKPAAQPKIPVMALPDAPCSIEVKVGDSQGVSGDSLVYEVHVDKVKDTVKKEDGCPLAGQERMFAWNTQALTCFSPGDELILTADAHPDANHWKIVQVYHAPSCAERILQSGKNGRPVLLPLDMHPPQAGTVVAPIKAPPF